MENAEFDFWRDHAEVFLKMAFDTDRRERIRRPDGYGKKTGRCGDTVELFLTVGDDRIHAVHFDLDGCLHTAACCNAVARLAEGRSPAQAWEITPDAVAAYLQTLPPDHHHCAELAVGALYLALADCGRLRRNPWKKAYR